MKSDSLDSLPSENSPTRSTAMPEQGIIPSVQRSLRNGIGYAGDAAGNIVNANAKAVQDAAWAAGRRADGVARSLGGPGKTAGKGVSSSSSSRLGKQVEGYAGYAGYAGAKVGAVGRYVDGGGRAAGGRVGDLGNSVKDKSGAKGKRMSTPGNPLGLNKPHV